MATRKRKTRRNSTVRLPYDGAAAVAPSANPLDYSGMAKSITADVMRDPYSAQIVRGMATNDYVGIDPHYVSAWVRQWLEREGHEEMLTPGPARNRLSKQVRELLNNKIEKMRASRGDVMKRAKQKSRAGSRNPASRGKREEHRVRELQLYIDNDRNLNGLKLDIFANYAKKKDRGTFTLDQAIGGLMRNLVNVAARSYWRREKSITEPMSKWARYFSLATRDALAEEYAEGFLAWYRLDYGGTQNPAGAYRQHFPRTAAGRPQVPHKWAVELYDSKGSKLGSRKWRGKSREEARAAAQELVGTKLRKKNVASVVLDGPFGS